MALCVICQKPLTLRIDDEYEDEDEGLGATASSSTGSYVDDDVHLRCGCHFHWQCLLDASYEVTSCPNCKSSITSADSKGNQQVLCELKNEGGLQENLDILPILTEESYLRAYPEERKCRAFLEFCAEGDAEAIVGMLDNDEEDAEEGENGEHVQTSTMTGTKDILRYQDQLGSMSSGLHVAVQNQRTEVVWLLLLLASDLPQSKFPAAVLSAAGQLGVVRDDQGGKVDIRSLKNAEGKTAAETAGSVGGAWESWVREGLLQAP